MTREPIEPDTKDWTWVLDRPCPECGFDATSLHHTEVADRIRSDAADWVPRLHEPGVKRAVNPQSGRRWIRLPRP